MLVAIKACVLVFYSLALWANSVHVCDIISFFSDLEKEVESLKQQPKNNYSSSDDAILIQVCFCRAASDHVSAINITLLTCCMSFFILNHVGMCLLGAD